VIQIESEKIELVEPYASGLKPDAFILESGGKKDGSFL
jgi:hypothetical protein